VSLIGLGSRQIAHSPWDVDGPGAVVVHFQGRKALPDCTLLLLTADLLCRYCVLRPDLDLFLFS
jgi:hypothetical protein